jgi:hypothetical protein
MAACLLSALAGCTVVGGQETISTVDTLRPALARAAAGTDLRLGPGDYPLDATLVIPDGVTLVGTGEMTFGAEGRASGLRPGQATTLRLSGDWTGNGVELGNRSALRGLRIIDQADGYSGHEPRPVGRNLVVVASRRPADVVDASIQDCELITRQSFGVGPADPLGRALGVWTRNPAGSGPMHSGAAVMLGLERSIVSAPDSNALMAINFAARGTVEVRIRDSRLEGLLSAVGGTSRPDPVSGAVTVIDSAHTDYVAAGGFRRFGWQLFGGSGVPHPVSGVPPGADDSQLRLRSRGDRILGFQVGILAAAGRRVGALSGSSKGNRVDLDLRQLELRTEGDAAADLRWYGGLSEPQPGGNERLPPGEGNVLVVRMAGVTGSGLRENRYADVDGPDQATPPETGNRLQVLGTPEHFRRANRDLSPAPPDRYFLEDFHH